MEPIVIRSEFARDLIIASLEDTRDNPNSGEITREECQMVINALKSSQTVTFEGR